MYAHRGPAADTFPLRWKPSPGPSRRGRLVRRTWYAGCARCCAYLPIACFALWDAYPPSLFWPVLIAFYWLPLQRFTMSIALIWFIAIVRFHSLLVASTENMGHDADRLLWPGFCCSSTVAKVVAIWVVARNGPPSFVARLISGPYQQTPFNDHFSIIQSPRPGLGFVVVATREIRHELEFGGTTTMLLPVGRIALGLTSPVIH
jgi:hypothetical protein